MMGLASATVLAAGAGAAHLIRNLRRRRRTESSHRRQSAGHQPTRSAQWSAAAPTRAPADVAVKEEASTAQRLLGQHVGGDASTWTALTDPSKRPDRPRVPIPPELLAFEPEHTASLSTSVVAQTREKPGEAPHPACLVHGQSTSSCC